jgi:hypothetical protein
LSRIPRTERLGLQHQPLKDCQLSLGHLRYAVRRFADRRFAVRRFAVRRFAVRRFPVRRFAVRRFADRRFAIRREDFMHEASRMTRIVENDRHK